MDLPLSDVVDFATLIDPVEQLAGRESDRMPTGMTDFATLEGRPRTSATPPRRDQAEMWSYTPTMRERVAQFLMGDSRSSTRRDLVTKLLGTSGLGETKFGLADITPVVGSIFGVEEAYRAGDPRGMALAVLAGSAPARRGARSIERTLPARSPHVDIDIYNPPKRSPRPFAADYPTGAPHDATGRLTHDIEGRPLTAKYIVGRRTMGGADEALTPADVDAAATSVLGSQPRRVPASDLPANTAGLYDPQTRQIKVLKDLPPAEGDMVAGHEFGHGIAHIAGKIRTKGLEEELERVYNTLNNPRRVGSEAFPWGPPFLPRDLGYKGKKEIRDEYIAEAIRAYLADPNYLKTVAPKTAAAIRKAAYSSPELRKSLQFNSIAAAAAVPFIGARTDDEGESWEPDRM